MRLVFELLGEGDHHADGLRAEDEAEDALVVGHDQHVRRDLGELGAEVLKLLVRFAEDLARVLVDIILDEPADLLVAQFLLPIDHVDVPLADGGRHSEDLGLIGLPVLRSHALQRQLRDMAALEVARTEVEDLVPAADDELVRLRQLDRSGTFEVLVVQNRPQIVVLLALLDFKFGLA